MFNKMFSELPKQQNYLYDFAQAETLMCDFWNLIWVIA